MDKVHEYNDLQKRILAEAKDFLLSGGSMFYATCSVFRDENEQIISDFIDANPDWRSETLLCLQPNSFHDGFFLAKLTSP